MKTEKQSSPRSSGGGAKALRRALAERQHAYRELDRNLVLDGEPLADLALEQVAPEGDSPADGDSAADGGNAPGVDREAGATDPRLWLVLIAEHLDVAAAARALATIDHARELGPLLADALESTATRTRIALVVSHLAEGGRAALAPALDAGLVLLRQHKLRGTSGQRILIERLAGSMAAEPDEPSLEQPIEQPVAAPSGHDVPTQIAAQPVAAVPRAPLPVAGLAPDPARFVAALDASVAPLAAELIRRQGRLDPALTCEGDEFGLAWVLDEEPLCTLSPGADGLECRLAGTGVPHLLSSAPDLEEWLDFLLAHLVEHWPMPTDAGRSTGGFEIPRPEAGGHWLSAEELEAFRD